MLNRLMLGLRVEVRSNEDRYRSAWLEGVIMAVYVPPGRGRRYKIRYDPYNFELLTDNGQPLTEEDVSATQVRPIPPSFKEKHSYSVGDVVEFYDKRCWWLGTVIQVLHAGKYFLIHNPHIGLYNEFDLSQLRDAKVWSKKRWSLLYSQQSGDAIYDGNCPVAENSEQTSVASSPGDMQADVQSQQQPEHEADKQRRQCGLIGMRVCYCLYVILGLRTLGTLMENLYLVHPMISVMVLAKNYFRLVADL